MPAARSIPLSALAALTLSADAEGGSLPGGRALSQLAFTLEHDGHCAGGWIAGSNTQQASLQDCYEHCNANLQCGFFAFSDTGQGCSLYTTAGGCPDDDKHADYNAYRMPYITGPQVDNLWHTRWNISCNNNYDTSGEYRGSPEFLTKEAAIRACLALGNKCVAITDYLCQEGRREGTGIAWTVCTRGSYWTPRQASLWCVYENPANAAGRYEQLATNVTCADNPPHERTHGSVDHGTVGSLAECQAICNGEDECAYLTYYTAKFESRFRDYPDKGTCITCKFDGWTQRRHPFGQIYAKVNSLG